MTPRARRRALLFLGGALGAGAAFAAAKILRPLLPVPSGGVGFVTVHRIPKAIDTVRFLLLLTFIPLGAFVGAGVAGRESLVESVGAAVGQTGERGRDGPQAGARRGKLLFFIALAFLALRFSYSAGIHGPVDLFHAGHYLSPASDALAGKAFFRDSVPFHGLLTDGGLDALAFRLSGETLAVSRALRIGLDLLLFSAALWVLASLARSPGAFAVGAALLALLTSAFRLDSGFPYFRTLPLLLGGYFTVRAVQTGRRGFVVATGAAAGLGVFWSLDTGLFALAAVLAWFFLDAILRRTADRRRFGALLAGLALGASPGLAYLVVGRGLARFVGDSRTIAGSMDAIWGLPAPAAGDLLRSFFHGPITFLTGEPLHFYLPVFAFASIAAWLLLRWRAGRFGQREEAALALLVFSVAGYRTALGRASYSHTRFSMVAPSMLFAFLLGSSQIRLRRLRGGALAASIAAAGLLAVYAEAWPAAAHAWERVRGFGPRWEGKALSPVTLARWGSSKTTPDQAASLEALSRFSVARRSPGDTFYDFSNSGALYFFLDRRNPARLYEASCLSAGDFEREAIADVARARPGFVVVSAPGEQDFDGVPNEVRAPKMAAWIRENYPREINVGGFGVRVP